MYFQQVIKAFQKDVEQERQQRTVTRPDYTASQFVDKLKMSLIKEKYPSVPYYNVQRGALDFQVLPDVIMDYDVSKRQKKFDSPGLQRRYEELMSQMRDLENRQQTITEFVNQQGNATFTRRNSFS